MSTKCELLWPGLGIISLEKMNSNSKLSWEATLQLLEQESPQLIFAPEGLSSVISNKPNEFREGKKQTCCRKPQKSMKMGEERGELNRIL